MVDESNDSGDRKFMAILLRVFDPELQRITTKFLAMPVCNIGTGENLFNAVNQVFIDRDIPWGNCIGFGSDNCNAMIGRNNSLLSRIREKNPKVINVGCVCHLANLCVQAAAKTLPVPVEDVLIDIFFHFHHSAKRKEVYKEFQAFTETEPMKIVKHCATRWLSLEKCVKRILQQWPALRSYFESHEEGEKPGRVQRTKECLTDPLTWLIFSFLDHIIPLMTDFNTTFQAGSPMVGHLHTEMQRLMRKLLGKFVRTQAIAAAKDVTSVNFLDDEVQHQDSIIAVGLKTRQYLQENEETLPPGTSAKFFRHVRLFYTSLASSLLKKFPFNDDILKTLSFLNPETREKTSAEAVVQLGMRVMPDLNAESLLEEVVEFHITPLEDLPPYRETVQPEDPADEPRDIITEDSLQKFWVYMRNRQLPGRSQRQFPTIPKVALACLAIPHSNVDPERCFSILRKIQTDSRSRLTSETIHNLLSVKFNEHNICSSFVPSKDMLYKSTNSCN